MGVAISSTATVGDTPEASVTNSIRQAPPQLEQGRGLAGGNTALGAAKMARRRFDLKTLAAAAAEALERANRNGDTELAAEALSLSAFVSAHVDSPPRALEALQKAAAACEAADQPHLLADTLCSLGKVHMHAGDANAAKTCFAGALEIAAESDDRQSRATALNGLGWTGLGQDQTQARALFAEAKAVAEEVGDDAGYSESLCFLADIARMRGDFAQARRLLDEAVTLALAGDSAFHQARCFSARGRLAQDEANLEQAKEAFKSAAEAARKAGVWYILVRALQGLARISALLGEAEATQQLLEEAIEVAHAKQDREGLANSFFALGRLAREQGDERQAIALHQSALGLRNELGSQAGLADSLGALAGLLARRRPSTAARLMGTAKSLRDSLKRPQSADMEICPCCRDDAEAVAQAVQSQALQFEAAQGAAMSGDDAVAYVSRGRGARLSRAPSGWESLTRMEGKVTALVAEGLSNPEIGERLFVSKRTVGSHLARIFQKVGVNSRTQLAREAVRQQSPAPPDNS